MATFTLRRFTKQETLKSIQREDLLALLGRYKKYFTDRGVILESKPGEDLDYEGIARVLMDPDETTPPALVDDLFFVDEMATPEGLDALREEIAKLPPTQRKKLELGPDPTPADVAVKFRLYAPGILEKKHAESALDSKRSFWYFQPTNGNGKPFQTPTDNQLRTLEAGLDDSFDQMKRGRNSKVYVFERPDDVWLLVRHGDPCERRGTLNATESASVYYRPEVFDVIRYIRQTGELSISAGSYKKIYDLYREKIGLYLFDDALYFPVGKAKFTLDPLRTDGEKSIICSDINGMESVVLKEVHYFWGGPEKEVEVRRASDLFKAFTRRNWTIPENARISKAKFEVKFSDSKSKRIVAITNFNNASFTRDSDASVVEAWLTERKFALVAVEANA